jgi:hypothetical protein
MTDWQTWDSSAVPDRPAYAFHIGSSEDKLSLAALGVLISAINQTA